MQLSKKHGYFFEGFDTFSAFEYYESVRQRLPKAEFPEKSLKCDSLLEVAPFCDVFVFDAFGVLNVGNTAIAGAAECIAKLRALGKKVYIITNAATFPAMRNLQKFQGLGYDFSAEEIVTSRLATESALEKKSNMLWGVMSKSDFTPEDLKVDCVLLADNQRDYDKVDGFLLLSTWNWDIAHQKRLEASLSKKMRPVMVANPDVIAPLEERFSTEAGYVAHRLADCLGAQIEFHGKPFASVFKLIEAKLLDAIDRKRICMIGDTLHTDVLGGAAMGWSTVLVSDHGLFRGLDPEQFILSSGITPDFIVPSI